MLNKQNGVCLLCGSLNGKMNLAVDHCHTTKVIRGLLCTPCNIKLGFYERNKPLTAKFEEYLKEKKEWLKPTNLRGENNGNN